MTADRIVEELVSNQATTLCRPGFKSIPGGGSLASDNGSPGSGSLWPADGGHPDVPPDRVKTLRDAYYSSLKDPALLEEKHARWWIRLAGGVGGSWPKR